jgi:hypothetical protein
LTGTGALGAGEITTTFGNINIGTSTFTGNGSGLTNVNADTLDGIDSANFLRSNVADTMGGLLTMSHAGDEMIRMQDTSATGNPYISWYQSTTRRAYMQYRDSDDSLYIKNEGANTALEIDGGTGGLIFQNGSTNYTVWHSGNDGAGSGLSADNLDGLSSGSFLRSDANDSFSGTLSGAGSINITGNVTAANFTGNGSGLTGITADNANTLDGIDSTSFIRKDAAGDWQLASSTNNASYTYAALELRELNFASAQADTTAVSPRLSFHWGGRVASQISMTSNGWINIINNPGTGYESFRASNIYGTGEITAYYSDERLKEKVGKIENALDKVLSIETFLYKNNKVAKENGFEDDNIHVGVSAQSVEHVLPEVVKHAPFDIEIVDGKEISKTGEWYKTVQYEKLAPLLIEAIKEQDAKIESQAAEIAELKAMVQKLLDK